MRLHVVLFTFFISTICSFSQTPSLKFTHITTEDGLSSSWVRCIYQDKTGFIWFGTSDGVDRYDGYTLKVFKPKEDDPYSLIHSDVNYITEHSDGKLWICTTQGVNILNLENFQFLPRIRVIHVMTDNQGRNWFSTYTGVFVYSPKDSSIVNYLHDPDNPNSLSYNQTDMVFQDKDKNIWIATDGAFISKFNFKNQTFKRYKTNCSPT